jgi:hypothetical protein
VQCMKIVAVLLLLPVSQIGFFTVRFVLTYSVFLLLGF